MSDPGSRENGFDVPKPSWRPLREGILDFQYAAPWPDKTSAELVQFQATQVARGYTGVEISYLSEERIFEIEVRRSQGDVRSFTMKLSDLAIRAQSDEALNANFEEKLDGIRRSILNRLGSSLRYQLKHGATRVFARVGSPLERKFQSIPSDVLDHFQITDWRNGVAVGPADATIYSMHLERIEREPAMSEPSMREALQKDGRKPARFARFLLAEHGGKRPNGRSLKVLEGDFLKWAGTPNETIDDKTMRAGIRLAEAVAREESGIPEES